MFTSNVLLKGKHATYAKFLSRDKGIDREGGSNVFERLLDVYMLAPVMGMLYGRRASVDNESKDTANIMAEQTIKVQYELRYIYRLLMLCNDEEGITDEIKIKKAFKDYADSDEKNKNLAIFHSYVLGGIEVLYEKFTQDAVTKEDYLAKIVETVGNFKRELEESALEISV